MNRFLLFLNVTIAILTGGLVLLGYFVDNPTINNFQMILLEWMMILAGSALLIGIGNMFSVHLQKIREHKPGSVNSAVLLFFMLLTLLFGFTPDFSAVQGLILNGILIPVSTSLLALLAVTLIYFSMRLLQTRRNAFSVVFLLTILIILLALSPLPVIGGFSFFSDSVRYFISNSLVLGGARGILIGIGLGTLTTGLRVLLGADRPYGGD